MPPRRIHLLLLLALVAGCVLGVRGFAAAAQPPDDAARHAKLKAVCVLNFMRYTKWPADRLPEGEGELVVRVLGDPAIADLLDQLAQTEKIAGRPFVVERLQYPEARATEAERTAFAELLRTSHVTYVGSAVSSQVRPVLETLNDQPVLTVSDAPGFARAGGMLGLAVRNQRLAFDANTDEIRAAGLTVSSDVLRLATIVKTEERKP